MKTKSTAELYIESKFSQILFVKKEIMLINFLHFKQAISRIYSKIYIARRK